MCTTSCLLFQLNQSKNEKLIHQYKNVNYEPLIDKSELTVKVLDDSMEPYYLKNDRIFFEKQEYSRIF